MLTFASVNLDRTRPDSCLSPSPQGASPSPSPQGASPSPQGMSPSPSPRSMSPSPSPDSLQHCYFVLGHDHFRPIWPSDHVLNIMCLLSVIVFFFFNFFFDIVCFDIEIQFDMIDMIND